MELEKTLQSLGLREKEAKVYLSLLKLGRGSAQSISSDSGLKRPTVYVILEELKKEGVIYEVPKSSKKLYRPLSPEILLERVEKKVRMVRKALPQIEAMLQKGGEKPQAIYFEGVKGVKEALSYKESEMIGKEFIGFWAKTNPVIMKEFDNYTSRNERWKQKNIKMRGFAPADSSLTDFRNSDKEFGREIIELPLEKYSSDIAVEIGEDFVRFQDPVNMHALIIDNPQITKTMKEIFELIWVKY